MISKAALKRIALEQAREDALDQEFEMSLYTDDGTALAARLRPSSEYVTVSGDAAAAADDTKLAMPPHRKTPSTDTTTGAPAETLIAEDEREEEYLDSSGEPQPTRRSRAAGALPSGVLAKRSRQVIIGVCIGMAVVAIFAVALVLAKRDGSPGDSWESKLLVLPRVASLKQHLFKYSQRPSVAGSAGDNDTVSYTVEQFKLAGISDVQVKTYHVLLSLPKADPLMNPSDRNRFSASLNFSMLTPYAYTAEIWEPPVPGDDTSSDEEALPTFNAFSASKDVSGELVYVNYGRKEDFDLLASMGVPLAGKIAIARYGENFRGLKAMVGERLHNIAGLVIYSDPADDGYKSLSSPRPVYPAGPWRPEQAVQRGAAQYLSIFSGDALTPGVAAVNQTMDRKYTPDTSPVLPHIPIMPISYGSAYRFLAALSGLPAPTADATTGSWQGALNFTYHIGAVTHPNGTIHGGGSPVTVRLNVQMEQKITPVWDVIATIPGRYYAPGHGAPAEVLVGAHRDAWVFGAVDPHSGSAVLLELAFVLGSLLKQGWVPDRTIRLCSWDAEESGLLGSVEYVEDRQLELKQLGIAYLNLDAAVSGPYFSASASPSLNQLIRDVTKRVPDPSNIGNFLYDTWKLQQPASGGGSGHHASNATSGEPAGEPIVQPLGSGSDYTPFLQFVGISALDVRFSSNGYGVYHSIYDSFHWMAKFGDPDFLYHKALTQVIGLLTLRIADQTLALDYNEYANIALVEFGKLHDAVLQMRDSIPMDIYDRIMAASQDLATALENFRSATYSIQDVLKTTASKKTLPAVAYDLALVERAFLSDAGLPYRSEAWYKHLMYAPSLYGGYDASVFPGLTDAQARSDWSVVIAELNKLTAAFQAVQKAMEKAVIASV